MSTSHKRYLPAPDDTQAESVADSPWRTRISFVAAFAAIAFFIATFLVAIGWRSQRGLLYVMFGAAFLCAVVRHFTTDREHWLDY